MGTRLQSTRLITIGLVAIAVMIAACRSTPGEMAPTPAPDATTTGPVIEIDTTGEPPGELTVTDLTDGSGDVADEGEVVRVSYVGRGWRSGVDVGSLQSPLFEFRLGDGEVIEGFERGIDGMAEGGTRRIVVPPDFAYGAADLGPLTGDTLVFVVELVEVVGS